MKRLAMIIIVLSMAMPAMALDWNACLHYLFQDAPANSWRLQDDGQGPYIKKWFLVAPKPTVAQMEAVEALAIPWWKDKIEDAESDYDKWSDIYLKALTEVVADELGLSHGQMKAKIKQKIKKNGGN